MSAIRSSIAHLLSLIVLLVGLAGSAPALAANYRNASAGAACRPANGALSAKFTYNLHYLTNVGSTDAYVICSLVMDDASPSPAPTADLRVDVFTTTAGTTVTCVAQVGAYYGGAAQITGSSAASVTSVVDSASSQLAWNTTNLQRSGVHLLLVINCKLPPGTKLGLIQYTA